MSSDNCPITDRRENVCPIAGQIAEDAAKKAVCDLFAKLGYDINKTEDTKKLVLLFDFLDRTSQNVAFGKKVAFKTVITMAVFGVIGMIGLKVVKGN